MMHMSIKVRFFASFRERVGMSESAVAAGRALTVADVWAQAAGGKPLPANALAAVNMEYVPFDRVVKDGDEVAFFPPVTGG